MNTHLNHKPVPVEAKSLLERGAIRSRVGSARASSTLLEARRWQPGSQHAVEAHPAANPQGGSKPGHCSALRLQNCWREEF